MGIVQGLMMSYGGKKGREPGANTVAYYPLATDANDYSGNGRHGVPQNIERLSYGDNGVASFNAVNSRIIANDAKVVGDMTISVWVRPDLLTGNRYLFCDWSGQGRNFLIHTSGTDLYAFSGNGATLQGQIIANNGLSYNTRNHIVYTRSSGYVTLYIDGVVAISGNMGYNGGVTNNDFYIGSGAGHDWFGGYMNEIIVEDIVWTPEQVLEYYNSFSSLYG